MPPSPLRLSALSLLAAAALGLSACGPADLDALVVPTSAPPLVTQVPSPSYLVGSAERDLFAAMNATRSAVGVGLLAQDVFLDTAARNHDRYLNLNPDADLHIEDPLLPGYTGRTVIERILNTGLGLFLGTENVGFAGSSSACVRGWLSDLRYRVNLLGPATGVGIGASAHYAVEGLYAETGCTATFAGSSTQFPAPGVYPSYPVTGQTDVPLASEQSFAPEYGATGYPVTVLLQNQATRMIKYAEIRLTQVTFTGPAGPVPFILMGGRDLRGPGLMGVHVESSLGRSVNLLPGSRLTPYTTYTVTLAGELAPTNGAPAIPFARTIQFTTGLTPN